MRQELINQFNNTPSIFIFLLSTRAAGIGINLTSADTVIFYDICYNPQVDRQAEDRCHRLGQTKQVNIFKLVVKDSCEEDIIQMAYEKKELNDIILQEGSYQQKTSKNSNNLFSFFGDLFNPKKSISKKDLLRTKEEQSQKVKKSKKKKKGKRMMRNQKKKNLE